MLKERTTTLEQVTARALVHQMIRLEPELLAILKTASLYTDAAHRWHMYEECKQRAIPLVGFDARLSELATQWHWHALSTALDALLPPQEEQEKDEKNEYV